MEPNHDMGKVSDGYHTFDELYRHRSILMLALMQNHRLLSWYSELHHDGLMPFDGMFIVGMGLPEGQITYHLERDPWWDLVSKLGVDKLDKAPPYDGHTSDDVVERLRQWIVRLTL